MNEVKSKRFRATLGAVLIALLCACNGEPSEYISVCTKSHVAMHLMLFPNGNGGMRMQMMPKTICDQREMRRNPKYDEWIAKNKGT